MKHLMTLLGMLAALSACGGAAPLTKEAHYDPATGVLVLPAPCPDWSASSTANYDNENHSNFGCATSNNMAVQLENPRDLYEGHGTNSPDAETTAKVIDDYRAGKIPVELQPQQSSESGAQ